MENFIKEGKGGFDFASVSSSTKLVNANRLLVHALVYTRIIFIVIPIILQEQNLFDFNNIHIISHV